MRSRRPPNMIAAVGFETSERVAVVTGASRGIGRAVAQRLAWDGFAVVALGRDAEALARTASLHERISVDHCDVTDEERVAELLGAMPHVDVLVNNAGVAGSSPLARITLEDWNRHLAVNATGAFLCTRAVLAGMVERDWGRIITVASVTAHVGSRYIAAYTASKHAALGLMRSVAAEVAGTGVTANTVSPSYVRSDMTDRTIANIVATTGRTPEEAVQSIVSRSPLGRLVEPGEVAAAVSYLAGDDAGAVNGQSIILDGGGIQQ